MTDTHCPYCSLQCGMTLSRKGPRLEVSERSFPVNEGALCRKGWTAAGLRGSRERLTTPMVRDRATGEWSAATWEKALDLVASKLADLREVHGADANAREPGCVCRVAVAAAVDIPGAGPGDDRVLCVGADGDEIE